MGIRSLCLSHCQISPALLLSTKHSASPRYSTVSKENCPLRSGINPITTFKMPFLDVAILPLRGIQALFSIIVLGLTAYSTPPPNHPNAPMTNT